MSIFDSLAWRAAHVNAHATNLYRLSRWLWVRDRRAVALLVYTVNRIFTGVDIPPQAAFGKGFLIMHGMESLCIPTPGPVTTARSFIRSHLAASSRAELRCSATA